MGNLRLDWLKFIFQALDEIKLNNQKKKKRRQNRKKLFVFVREFPEEYQIRIGIN